MFVLRSWQTVIGGDLRPVRHRAVSPHQKQVQPGVAARHYSNWLEDQKQLKAKR